MAALATDGERFRQVHAVTHGRNARGGLVDT